MSSLRIKKYLCICPRGCSCVFSAGCGVRVALLSISNFCRLQLTPVCVRSSVFPVHYNIILLKTIDIFLALTVSPRSKFRQRRLPDSISMPKSGVHQPRYRVSKALKRRSQVSACLPSPSASPHRSGAQMHSPLPRSQRALFHPLAPNRLYAQDPTPLSAHRARGAFVPVSGAPFVPAPGAPTLSAVRAICYSPCCVICTSRSPSRCILETSPAASAYSRAGTNAPGLRDPRAGWRRGRE
ncbi:hypothetical protein DFH11DRAFT_1296202 [Phellopilus nigrolimitatus]|nr:hypothetical protein DFH11DRAFT_1296202 [Phellopilus nigrolimitatus]